MSISLSKIKDKINSSDIAKRMASGAIWTFTGTALAKLIVLIAGVLCARILGKELYGEFGMVRSTINMFVALGTAGMGMTATKYISEYRKEQKERTVSIYLLTNSFAVITGVIITVVILILADFLAETTLDSPHLAKSLKVGALLLFVTVLNGAQNGTLSGFENFKSIAINTFIASIFETIFMLVGAHYHGVYGAILGYGIGFVSLYVLNYISIRGTFKKENVKISIKLFNKNDLSLLLKFSLPAMLSSLLLAPTYWIVRTMLVNDYGFEELAIYEAAEQWRIIILFIPSAVGQIVLPILSSLVNGSTKTYWKVLYLNILINFVVTLILVAAIAIFSRNIMYAYGDDFNDIYTLIVLSSSAIFAAISNVVGSAIASKGRMWIGFLFNLIWSILTIGFTILFIKLELGAMSIALAFLSSYILHLIYQYIYLVKKDNCHTISNPI